MHPCHRMNISKGSIVGATTNGWDHNTPAKVTPIEVARLFEARRMARRPQFQSRPLTPYEMGQCARSLDDNPFTDRARSSEWADGWESRC